jgi:hypothetical protein
LDRVRHLFEETIKREKTKNNGVALIKGALDKHLFVKEEYMRMALEKVKK